MYPMIDAIWYNRWGAIVATFIYAANPWRTLVIVMNKWGTVLGWHDLPIAKWQAYAAWGRPQSKPGVYYQSRDLFAPASHAIYYQASRRFVERIAA